MQPWFDANAYGWVPGVSMGLAGFSTSVLASRLAPLLRGKRAILRSLYIQFVVAAMLLAAALIGLSMGQPMTVNAALGIPAIITFVMNSLTLRGVLRKYRAAEKRQAAQQ